MEAVETTLNNETASTAINGHRSPLGGRPSPAQDQERETVIDAQSLDDQHPTPPHAPDSAEQGRHVTANGRDDDANSEAETLIDSPVKKREAEKAHAAAKAEKPARSRIGSLPVPGEDDDEDESVATPMQSTELSDAKAASSADAIGEDDDEMDMGSDKENSSVSLSSIHSSRSRTASRASSQGRALSERPEFGRNGAESLNPRKRKHRASSVSFPRKRQSMEPPKRKLRGIHSEDNALRTDRSSSPQMRAHRRAVSTQSALLDGTAEGGNRTRRAATHFPVRDPKSIKTGWEESDASSETTSHGQADLRRPQRGIGRSTSTPGRPVIREHKRHINKYGFTRLAEACETAELDLVKEWREKDPDQLELAEFAGNKPLQIAALNGNDEVVAYLIDQGCQIDCANVDKDTPLIDAAENGHSEVVRILLNAGVDPLRQNLKGQQALDVVSDDTDNADGIRAALRQAIESWNSVDAKQRREEEEEQRHRAGPNKELHFMARSYENLLKLVTNNDRTGVREFLDARVPVDNAIIAAAAKTGDQYLVNMLLAEMTPKKANSKADKPVHAVLGTSHFEMVKFLTTLDQFNPLYHSRAGKTWAEIAEEKNGPNWRLEKELLQRLYDEGSRTLKRQSSSPVTKRENGSKRRVVHGAGEDDDSDEAEAPKRKNGRRLMSKRDMRAASGKPLSDLESSDEDELSTSDINAPSEGLADPMPMERKEALTVNRPESPSRRRSVGRPRTQSTSSQPATSSSSQNRRRSSNIAGSQDKVLATVEEKSEGNSEEKDDGIEKQRQAEAMFAVHEAQRLEQKRREEEASEAEAKRVEEEARKAMEEQQVEQARREAEVERKRQAEEEAIRVAQEKKDAEERAAREKQMAEERQKKEAEREHARRKHVEDLLASLPKALAHSLGPESSFRYDGKLALAYLQEHFTPLLVVREDSQSLWVLNAQAAPLLGKRGLELLLPRSNILDFPTPMSGPWPTHGDFTAREEANVQRVVSQLTAREGNLDSGSGRDAEMTDGISDFQAELKRTAERLNAAQAAKTKLASGLAELFCIKLDDVLSNLDPVLKDAPIEVRFLSASAQSTQVRAMLKQHGIEGFVPRFNAFFTNVKLGQTYRAGQVDETGMALCAGKSDVVVVHEK